MSNIVKLNVGGTHYETTTTTLMRFGDSMLARMIQQPNEMEKISRGEELFIDRVGANFGYILNYLHDGDEMITPRDEVIRERLIGDAGFYQLPGLVDLIKAASTLKIGDLVQLANSEAARAYFDFVISQGIGTNGIEYMCWMCHIASTFSQSYDTWRSTWHRAYEIPLKFDLFIGRISSIDGQCAKVAITKGCLMAVISYFAGSTDDSIFEIHIPLAYLKLSTQ